MAELNIRLDIRLSPRVFKGALAAMLVSGMAHELASENVTLTTYYPAPSGVYTQMITTSNTYLARDGGAASRVGVGTTSPQNKMDVAGSMAVGTYAGVNAAPANGLIVSGNVGLGTTAPGAKLDVGGTTGGFGQSGGVAFVGSAAGAGVSPLLLQNKAAEAAGNEASLNFGGASNWMAQVRGGLRDASGNGYLALWTSNAGTVGEWMRIDNTGNVGIGTTNPAAALDVGTGSSGVIMVVHAAPLTGSTCAGEGICSYGAGISNCPAGTFATLISGLMSKYQIINYPGAQPIGQSGDPAGDMICENCPTSGCPSL